MWSPSIIIIMKVMLGKQMQIIPTSKKAIIIH
jgi:hypothetical protein